jgi:hypothetical protein
VRTKPGGLRKYLLHELKILKIRLKKKRQKKSPQQTFGKASTTLKGEMVRSQAEKRIADFLFCYNIPYAYEPTLELGNILVKPDFYLPKQEIYVEFWGLVANKEYAERMRRKLQLYQRFRVKLLSLFSEDLGDLEKSLTKRIPQ